MDTIAELETTISDRVQAGKGILAADESAPTIAKRFAAICQTEGFVPIVEPEVLIEGNHSIKPSAEVINTVPPGPVNTHTPWKRKGLSSIYL